MATAPESNNEVVVEEGVLDSIGTSESVQEEGDIEELIKVEGFGSSVLPGENVQKTEPQPSALLTELGILVWTNIERVNYGANPLVKNSVLDQVAERKLDDMFENQYFAHESPTGDYVGDVADDVGYEYLLIGENLAYGDFGSDKALVDAWMDSEGHRANILNENYTEIGIAVKKGDFKGRETWIAVQSFGVPYSKCDFVSDALLAQINEGKDELAELEDILSEMHDEIEATYPKSGPEYNEKVSDYNDLVAEYNSLLKEINASVKVYNGQVEEFKECVESAT